MRDFGHPWLNPIVEKRLRQLGVSFKILSVVADAEFHREDSNYMLVLWGGLRSFSHLDPHREDKRLIETSPRLTSLERDDVSE